jgi:hypothetical protein
MERSLCYNCAAELVEIRGKLICSTCHMIIETCCEGGLCTFSPATGGPRGQEEETGGKEKDNAPADEC